MSTTSTSPTPFPAGKTEISVCCSAPVRYSGHPSRYVCFSCGLMSEIKGDYQPKVGDRVSVEGRIVNVYIDGRFVICMKNGVMIHLSKEDAVYFTLLSRKSPRKVTRKELEEILKEPFELID